MLFDFQTPNWSEWTKDIGQVGFISWSKDGEYIYFDTFLTDKPFFGRVKLGRNKFERKRKRQLKNVWIEGLR